MVFPQVFHKAVELLWKTWITEEEAKKTDIMYINSLIILISLYISK